MNNGNLYFTLEETGQFLKLHNLKAEAFCQWIRDIPHYVPVATVEAYVDYVLLKPKKVRPAARKGRHRGR